MNSEAESCLRHALKRIEKLKEKLLPEINEETETMKMLYELVKEQLPNENISSTTR